MLRKASTLIVLIMVSSVVKFIAEMSQAQKVSNVPSTSHPLLQSQHVPVENHAASYYDPESSHYMGGAHNVALAQLAGEPLPTKNTYKGTNSERFNAQAAAYDHLSNVYEKNFRERQI